MPTPRPLRFAASPLSTPAVLKLAILTMGVLSAGVLASGCHNEAKEREWVSLDVAEPSLAKGWHRVSDAGSGVSLDLPDGWVDYQPNDPDFRTAALAAMKASGSLPQGGAIEMNTVGSVPDLASISLLPEDLRSGMGILIEVRHNRLTRKASLEEAGQAVEQAYSGGFGVSGDAVTKTEILKLPIGPVRYRETVFEEGGVHRVQLRLMTYYFVHENDFYTVAFRVPSSEVKRLGPTFRKIIETIRLVSPDPDAKRRKREAAIAKMKADATRPTPRIVETGTLRTPQAPDPYAGMGNPNTFNPSLGGAAGVGDQPAASDPNASAEGNGLNGAAPTTSSGGNGGAESGGGGSSEGASGNSGPTLEGGNDPSQGEPAPSTQSGTTNGGGEAPPSGSPN